jgi:hypothetical protein
MKIKYATNFRMDTLRMAILVIFAFFSTISWGQIAAWQFGDPISSGNETTYAPTTVNPNVTVSSLSRGAGIDADVLQRAFISNNWDAATESSANTLKEYYEFSINVNTGRFVSLSELNAILRRSSGGPDKYIWKYSLDGTTFYDIGSSVSFTSSNYEGTAQTPIDLSSISALQNVQSGTTITLRLYAWDASSTATGTFSIGRTPASTSTNALSISGVAGIRVNPVISTQAVTDTLTTTAIGHGTIATLGFPESVDCGICVSTNNYQPTISDTKFPADVIRTGTFKSFMTNLTPNRTYYARAYITNDRETFYGETQTFYSSKQTATMLANASTEKMDFVHQVFDANQYRGKNYTIYTKDSQYNLNLGSLLIDNSKAIIADDFMDLSATGQTSDKFTCGALTVANDTLLAFHRSEPDNTLIYGCFITDTNNKLKGCSVKTGGLFSFTLPGTSTVEDQFYKHFGATTFNNQPYLLVERADLTDNKLYLVRGISTRTGFNWIFVDTVKDEYGNAVTICSTTDDTFDLTSVKCNDGTDSLVVGRSTNNKITLYWYNEGKQNWKVYHKPTSQNLATCFKMVQGALAGTGVNENKNMLQCIAKNDSYTMAESFDINNRQFSCERQLTQRQGIFGATTAIVGEMTNYLYQQYIVLATGDLSNQTDVEAYQSNKILVQEISAKNDTIMKTPALRGLATLVGIIEGPPPSALETQAEYEASYNLHKDSPGTLQRDKSCETTNSTTTTFTGGGQVGVDFGAVSASVSYKRETERSVEKTVTNYQTINIYSKRIEERDSAILVYNVPNIRFNQYYLCSPSSVHSNSYTKVIDSPLFSDIALSDVMTYFKRVPLKDAPFDVKEPRSLYSWEDINRFFHFQNGSSTNTNKGKTVYNYYYGSNSDDWFSDKISYTTAKSKELSVSVEAKFFKVASVKATASYAIKKTHTSTYTEQLKLTLRDYTIYDKIGGRYASFDLIYDMWTYENNPNIADHYYTPLRNSPDKLCLPDETPWIITYKVASIKPGITTNISETGSDVDKFNIRIYRQGESSVSLEINSLSSDLLTVELYSLSGQKVQTLFNQQSIPSGATTLTADCNVPTGVYVVKSHTSNASKSSLVRL